MTVSVTSFAPRTGPSAGGTAVTVRGAGLGQVTRVLFGTVDATAVTVVDASTVTCIAPAHAQGQVSINAYDGQTSGVMWGYTYLDPQSLPAGRNGLWRVSAHRRHYSPDPQWITNTKITDLVDCRSRRLETALNTPAKFSFAVPGDSATARELVELATDIVAWRWDFNANADIPMFSGPITQSQDSVSEQEHTVTFTCQDYLAMLKRRFLIVGLNTTGTDQDTLVQYLVNAANHVITASGFDFGPAANLNVTTQRVNPDGTVRAALSGQLRDRNYLGQQNLWDALSNLAAVIGGFDFDIHPVTLAVRIYYPSKGVQQTNWILEYGQSVAALSRSINSANYGNYFRVLGQADDNAPQLAGEAWNADASDLIANPGGLWMTPDSASDVTVAATLVQKAQGDLATAGAMVPEGAHGARVPLPSYSLQLRPGRYYYGCANLGDTVQLLIRKGRLNLAEWVRVVGITYSVGDDGQEDVAFDVGSPAQGFIDLMTTANQRVASLERR